MESILKNFQDLDALDEKYVTNYDPNDPKNLFTEEQEQFEAKPPKKLQGRMGDDFDDVMSADEPGKLKGRTGDDFDDYEEFDNYGYPTGQPLGPEYVDPKNNSPQPPERTREDSRDSASM